MSQRKFQPEDFRIQRTKRLLNVAFMRLLQSRDYSQISIVEICEAAGLHRATFYKHYKDKDDFLLFSIDEFVCKITHNTVLDFEDPNFKTNYSIFMKKIFEMIEANKKLIKMLVEKTPHNLTIEAFYKSIQKIVKNNLNKNEKCEKLKNVNLDLIAVFFAGALVSLSYWWVFSENTYTTEEMVVFSLKIIDCAMKH
ncbi:MAG TPA: TetR/AcrR family transcriptional regulator [Clostridia bacterium]|nr:TetR/AcrR family transcriptional regulator [Clostridia bacterium]